MMNQDLESMVAPSVSSSTEIYGKFVLMTIASIRRGLHKRDHIRKTYIENLDPTSLPDDVLNVTRMYVNGFISHAEAAQELTGVHNRYREQFLQAGYKDLPQPL